MDDLERVVDEFEIEVNVSRNDGASDMCSTRSSSFYVGEFIAEVGEVTEILENDAVKMSYMHPKKVRTTDSNEHPRRYWY